MSEYRYTYSSLLKEYFQAFLDFKASKNQDEFSYAFLFKHMDTFLVDKGYGKTYIDREIYCEWLGDRIEKVSPVTLSRESSMMRTFLIFTTKIGNECYIPSPRKQPQKTYIPHVFSHDELEALFSAADNLRLRNRCTNNYLHMIPALFRLLYSTGLRLGESLNLRNKDVDMKARIIKLRDTKNRHERLAPINESLGAVLEEYLRNRNRIPTEGINLAGGYFFCGARGQKCAHQIVRRWFHVAREEAGIPYYGREGGPNVHCLRHTACVHALMKMVKSGKDPFCCLPTLTAFMGHRSVKATEYYLHLCEELYPEMVQLERNISSGVNGVIRNAIRQYIIDENR